MAKVTNGIETLPIISTGWVGRTNVKDRRQTDGWAMTFSERERETFTFANKTGYVADTMFHITYFSYFYCNYYINYYAQYTDVNEPTGNGILLRQLLILFSYTSCTLRPGASSIKSYKKLRSREEHSASIVLSWCRPTL